MTTILINFPFLIYQHILWFIPVQCSARLPMRQCQPKVSEVSVWQLSGCQVYNRWPGGAPIMLGDLQTVFLCSMRTWKCVHITCTCQLCI